MLSKQIEKAQRKVEEQNFLIRKRVLEYDDVMNEQRRIVYEYRDEVLEGKDMGEQSREELGNVVRRLVDEHTPGDFIEEWDLDGLLVALRDIFPTQLSEQEVAERQLDREELIEALTEEGVALYDAREEELGEELMRALERYLLLQIIDNRWREHLYDMDYLREGIHLRGFAQIEPHRRLQERGLRALLRPHELDLVGLRPDGLPRRGRGAGRGGRAAARLDRRPPARRRTGGTITYSGGGDAQPSALSAAAAAGAGTAVAGEYADEEGNGHGAVTGQVVQQRRVDADQAIGRNDPCWCGSGQEVQEVPRRLTGGERRTPRRR